MKNSSGQLGIGSYMDSCYPVYVPIDYLFPYRVKIVQISASFRASYLLTESRLILCSGTTGEFKSEVNMTKFNLRLKVLFVYKKTPEIADENSYTPLKIATTWTKSFSVFYAIFGDISEMNNKIISRQKVNLILNTLSSKWDIDSCKDILKLAEPPYIESIAGYFSSMYMKKKNDEKKISRKRSYVEELKCYIKR